MTTLGDYGGLLMGSRLKRISEAMYAGVDAVYRAHGVDLPSRCFPVLFLLRDNGSLGITDLASRLGQSHPAVSQMSRKLLEHGVVAEQSHPGDERRRLLALSAKGRQLMTRMEPIWQDVVGAVDDLAASTGVDLLGAVASLEGALEAKAFGPRISERARLRTAGEVEIIPFESRYRDDFKRLNVEWLEKYFYVEEIDHQVLSHPEERILKPGGHILFARYQGEIVGTCALIKAGPKRFEFSKMAVTERYQGLKIGLKLLQAALALFRKSGAKELFLESSSKLKPALALYEANGFVHTPKPKGDGHYRRADVYMVYKG
ncbi:MAG TPA: bifunctional helix-turn-helix transcriptional regulator/GNAT family N-acetyltransferase [Holophagaceae bacterium]|nr:bifunctional helix-turn-helix transcriptional regulator/GNAT family N-acetyltransferase [Holophagaceae bacterium]